MTARPVDWSPLADKDPIGGDPGAVRSEATYYSDLATEIAAQVTRLRRIASEDQQKGKAADKLRDAANKTADKLHQTHGRVAGVGSALSRWVPHLETAQTETLTALREAQSAHAAQQANQPPPAGTPAPKTDAEKQAAKDRAGRLDDANGALAAARRRFEDAIAERDRQAHSIKSSIEDALDDGLDDGFWDHIANWVSQHVDIIKMVVEVLTWVATAVAIACIFIPGLNILAIALTIGVLAGHSLLAATGNGSWVDVVLDVFALATLGAGRLLGTMAEEARVATLARAGDLAATDAATSVNASRAALRLEYEAAAGGLGKVTSLRGFRAFLSLKTGVFDAVSGVKAGWAAQGARQAMLTRSLPEDVGALKSLTTGGKDLAQNLADIKALRAVYGDDAAFTALADQWGSVIHRGQALVGAAQAVDLTNHLISTSVLPGLRHVLPGVPPWEHFKEYFVTGDSWAAGE